MTKNFPRRLPDGVEVCPEYIGKSAFDIEECVYKEGSFSVGDAVIKCTDGHNYGFFSLERIPDDAIIMSVDEARERIRALNLKKWVKDPIPETEEQFIDAFETLPPRGYASYVDGEIFFFEEAMVSCLHQVHCRVKDGEEDFFYTAFREIPYGSREMLESFIKFHKNRKVAT
jgi:hypothetical protein